MVFNMQPYGLQSMLKEGHRHMSGLEEAVLKNIDACQELSVITRTSLGPNGAMQAEVPFLHLLSDLLFTFSPMLDRRVQE